MKKNNDNNRKATYGVWPPIIFGFLFILMIWYGMTHDFGPHAVWADEEKQLPTTTISSFTKPTQNPRTKRRTIILNTSTKCYHLNEDCHAARQIEPDNKEIENLTTIEYVESEGYWPCGICAGG